MAEYKNGDRLVHRMSKSGVVYHYVGPLPNGEHAIAWQDRNGIITGGWMSDTLSQEALDSYYEPYVEAIEPGSTWVWNSKTNSLFLYEFYVYDVFEGSVHGRERDNASQNNKWDVEAYTVDHFRRNFKRKGVES